MDSYNIRQEKESDYYAVENLVREAFWNVYQPGCNEHYILNCLRNKEIFVPELDLIIEKGGEIIGQIVYVRSEIKTEGGNIPAMTFGPVSVAKKFQNKGYGTKLLIESMARAKNLGVELLAITGDIEFYGKFGFVIGKTKNIFYADDFDADYFLVKELTPNFLNGVTGIYKVPKEYFADAAAVEEFDKIFPPKQKLKLPTQIF